MKNYIKLPLILLVSIVISSCAALRTPDMTKISIGMDKATVIATLRKNPDGIVGSKKYPGGNLEVLRYNAISNFETTWLYFYKDKLVQFGKPTGNWIVEADILVADNG